MNTITKAWTYGVAYLSLGVGAGVSIAGNVADTYRTSLSVGHSPDGLDITISAFWPAAVLLAIEMFVSRLWPRAAAMQTVRWVGSLGIGFVAMYSSWHHLSDLLASRGQDNLVAAIGPLAIDGLAIMATGLILSSRGHKVNFSDTPVMTAATADTDTPAVTVPRRQYFATAQDVAESEAAFRGDIGNMTTLPSMTEADIDRWAADIADTATASESDTDLFSRLAADVATPSTPAAPVIPGLVSAVRPISPAGPRADASDVTALLAAWMDTPEDDRPDSADVVKALAVRFGRSERTARRWLSAALAS